MESNGCSISAGTALAEIGRLFDRIDPDRSGLDPAGWLGVVKTAQLVADRAAAFASMVLAEADAAQASMKAVGTPMSSWLGLDAKLSKREAAGALHRANRLAEDPQVAQAATSGRIGAGQARSISKVLTGLAPQLEPAQREQAAGLLIGMARSLDADQLAKSAGRVLAQVAPESADELLETRLQRQAEAAHRQRALRLWREDASVRFDGSLPRTEGEAWIALLDAHAESQRRCVDEERDPLTAPPSPEQRRADALIGMIQAHQLAKQAPSSGGDRPRIIVKLDYHQLKRDTAAAGLIGDDQPISAGELRRLCCDAGLLPAVLDGPSQVLDIGRETRTIPPPIRAALILRDRGCAFPTCHTRAAVCEAHHIQPWWKGGPTALANLVLLCHHHHALVEPARHTLRDQWAVRIAPDGQAEFIPPRRYDPNRRPVRHGRYAFDQTGGDPSGRPRAGSEPADPTGAASEPPGKTETRGDPSSKTETRGNPPGKTETRGNPPSKTETSGDPFGRTRTGSGLPDKTDTRGDLPAGTGSTRDPVGRLDLRRAGGNAPGKTGSGSDLPGGQERDTSRSQSTGAPAGKNPGAPGKPAGSSDVRDTGPPTAA